MTTQHTPYEESVEEARLDHLRQPGSNSLRERYWTRLARHESYAEGYLRAKAETAPLLAALKIIARTRVIRTQLELYDPKALEQLEAAIKQAKPKEGAA